jgi:tetratricopeptide (TPR) repeat protein
MVTFRGKCAKFAIATPGFVVRHVNQPASVFISYRRTDAAGHAGRLYDRLKSWFDSKEVFYDVDTIESGDNFPERIRVAVSSAKVVLVLIAPDWLAEINRRAGLRDVDFVRAEVGSALRSNALNGIPKIIPVLLGGARPLLQNDVHEALPSDLQGLLNFDALEFQGKNADWDHQFVRLRELIAGVPGVPVPRFRPPAAEPKPFRVIDHLLSPHFRDPGNALTRLRETLLAAGNVAIVVPATLYGMGGVGKTQLALKYTYEYRDSYAGIWWFRAETDGTLQADARDACQETGAGLVDAESPTGTFKRWLMRQEQPWLLVFDNAENAGALRPHLPTGGPHHVIVTSRDPAWGGVARPIEMAVWSDNEGADFLVTRLPGGGRSDLQRLSRALGGLQLALEQAAAFLEQTGGSIVDYCEQIDNVDGAALVLDEGRASTGYERSVLATLSLAFPRLSPAAQQLLRICAFFSAEPIPERYFREEQGTLAAVWTDSAPTALAWERIVGELRHFAIAERVDVASLDCLPSQPDERLEKALLLHRLTLEVARHALSVPVEDGPRAQQILRAHCPNVASDPKQWPRFTALLPHLGSFERLRSQSWLDRRVHSWMLNRAASYLRDTKSLYRESKRLFRSAIEIDKADLGDEHPDTLRSMDNLASTLAEQGEGSLARALQEYVLEVQRRELGEDHPETLRLMNNLALTLADQGDHAGARALQEQVLAVLRSVLGEECPETLTSMNNLALMLLDQGDHPGARALQEQVLAVQRRVLGEEHPDTLTSTTNLASTLRGQGDHTTARALQEAVLAARRRVFGEKHPDTLRSMNNLATTLGDQGDHTGARALQEEVLAVQRSMFGEDHPDTRRSINNLALTLSEQGDHAGARALQEQVLAVERNMFGEEHPDTLRSMNNLASTLGEQDDHTGARALQEQVLAVQRRVLGEEHPDTLRSMHNLTFTLGKQGDHTGARALQEQVLAVQRRVLGEEHPDTLRSMNNLAFSLAVQGDHTAARTLHERVLAARRRVLGQEHPDTLRSMHNLAYTLWEIGMHNEATALMTAAARGRSSTLGLAHPDSQASIDFLTEWRAEINPTADGRLNSR